MNNGLQTLLFIISFDKGNIGASEGGLPFLEEEELIPALMEIAEQSLIPSVRGYEPERSSSRL